MKLSTTRMLVLTGLVLVVGLLIGWGNQFVPGSAPSVVEAQTKGTQALDAARLALVEARNFERLSRTKDAAVAAQAALDAYNAAVDRRISEINNSLEELRRQAQRNGNPPEIVAQIQALLAELKTLQPSPAGPVPTVTPEVEPNNTSATAQVLISPDNCFIVQGSVSPSADLDFFRVDGVPAGAKAWFCTDTGGALVAGDRDSFVDILAADGTTSIESDDDNGTGNGGDGTEETGLSSSIAGRTLTAGGTYFFLVRGFGTFPGSSVVNPYRMFLTITNVAATAEAEANNTAATANAIVTAGQTTGVRSGTTGVADDVDFYSVVATAGNILFISVDGDPARTGANTLDGIIQLFAPDGTTALIPGEVDSAPDGVNNSEAFNYNISTSGTYFVRVADFFGDAGLNYNIMVSACQGAPAGGVCVLTCPGDVTQTNDPNECGAVVNYPAPTASGTCGTVTCSPSSGSFFPVGTTTVTCTSSVGPTCSFTVTVTDDQEPTITCPADQVRSNDPDQCGAVVNYPPPTVTDNCPGSFTATCSPPSGSFFPVGTTTVTCEVDGSNGSGKPSVAKPGVVTPKGGPGCQTITQSTSQAVVFLNSAACAEMATGFTTENSYYRAFTLTSFGINNAFDVTSVDIGIDEAFSGQAGKGAPNPSTSISRPKKATGKSKGKVAAPQGAGQPLTVNLYTSSSAFPTGFPGSLTLIGTTNINVADQIATIINIPVTGTAGAGSQLVVEILSPDGRPDGNGFFIGSNAAAETGPSYIRAVDCGIDPPATTAAIGFPDMHIVMNVNGCEQQGGGGGSSCTFTVTVNDTQPPTITCPPNQTAATPTVNDPCAVVNFTTTASDNCPGVTVVCSPPSGSCFPIGVTTVTCTATDASGNTATCTFTVSVFNGRLQDDFEACNDTVLFNTLTGDYRWCCHGVIFIGKGKVTRAGDTYRLEHNAPDRRVRIDLAAGHFPPTGSASIQSPPGTVRCVLQDRDTRDDTCLCGAPAPPK